MNTALSNPAKFNWTRLNALEIFRRFEHQAYVKWLGAFIPFFIFLVLSISAVDFGVRWDEDYNKADAVAYSLHNGYTLLPDSYVYPGVNYWLTFSCLTPEAIALWQEGKLNSDSFRKTALATLYTDPFRLRLRRLYAFVSSLTVVWIYLAVLVWRNSAAEGLLASLLAALSWEVIYHSRWVAPDEILMQFGALTIFFVMLSLTRRNLVFLNFAAAAAALGCGAKYPGGLLLLPVLAAIWLQNLRPLSAVKKTIVVGLIFVAVYLLTTPGTLVQPLKFCVSLRNEMKIYAQGWYGQSAPPGVIHLLRIVYYFANELFSANRALAAISFMLVPAGLVSLLRGKWRESVAFLIFPVIYALYFCTQRAMIVRNYLVLVPFLSILAARGYFWLRSTFSNRWVQWLSAAFVGFVLLFNFSWQVQASRSIINRHNTNAFLNSFIEHVQSDPKRLIAVSPLLEGILRKHNFSSKNFVSQRQYGFSKPFDEYASYYSETVLPRSWEWASNRPGTFAYIYGPKEVNLDYYVGWIGDDHIIVLSRSHFFKWRVDKPRLRTGP